MRVCQPGPVAFHRSMTSTGSRSEICLRGLAETGLPPFLSVPRANISSVSSGSSSYSSAVIACASTRARSDFKGRRDPDPFAFICSSHTEDMAIRATRRVANDNHSPAEDAKANDALLAVLLSSVFHFERDAREYQFGIIEVKSSFHQRASTLGWIVGDCHCWLL